MNAKQVAKESLATVDAALAILNKWPDLGEESLRFSGAVNPFPFLLELFKAIKGYDWVVDLVSSFLSIGLPAVEIAVKAALLSNLKNILSCNINPFVTNQLIKEGVAFDIDQIDLTDLLKHSPLDSISYSDEGTENYKPSKNNKGKFYYFDCEDCEIADDLRYSKDMNALFWYMKHKPGQRQVWGQTEDDGSDKKNNKNKDENKDKENEVKLGNVTEDSYPDFTTYFELSFGKIKNKLKGYKSKKDKNTLYFQGINAGILDALYFTNARIIDTNENVEVENPGNCTQISVKLSNYDRQKLKERLLSLYTQTGGDDSDIFLRKDYSKKYYVKIVYQINTDTVNYFLTAYPTQNKFKNIKEVDFPDFTEYFDLSFSKVKGELKGYKSSQDDNSLYYLNINADTDDDSVIKDMYFNNTVEDNTNRTTQIHIVLNDNVDSEKVEKRLSSLYIQSGSDKDDLIFKKESLTSETVYIIYHVNTRTIDYFLESAFVKEHTVSLTNNTKTLNKIVALADTDSDKDSSDNKSTSTGSSKHKKSDGIVTLDFHENANGMMNSDGTSASMQGPIMNCMQVFVGNAMPFVTEVEGCDDCEAYKEYKQASTDIDALTRKLKKIIEDANKQCDICSTEMEKASKLKKSDETYKKIYKSYSNAEHHLKNYFIPKNKRKPNKKDLLNLTYDIVTTWINNLQDDFNSLLTKMKEFDVPDSYDTEMHKDTKNIAKGDKITDASAISVAIQKLKNKNNQKLVECSLDKLQYPKIQQNYYYRRTIIQFDFDFIASIKLFDARVITAQLVDALVGCLGVNYDINLTAKEYFIKDQIQQMVQMIVQTDDVMVDDCFFAFSNDEYSAMLNRAEKKFAGLSASSNTSSPVKFDVDNILAMLDPKNSNSEQAGEMSVAIKGALQELQDVHNELTSPGEQGTKMEFNADVQFKFNILDQILDNLAYVIVSAVMSPKVYMLILFNLKVLGQESTFSLTEFIAKYTLMIVDLIRKIRDQILNFFVDGLNKLIKEISQSASVVVRIEQAKYYYTLIKRCIDCFKSLNNNEDWDMDNVMHADIESSDDEVESERTC